MVAYLFDDCLLVIKTDCGKTWWYLTVPETYLPPFTYGYGSYTKPFAFVLLSRFNLREKINLPKKILTPRSFSYICHKLFLNPESYSSCSSHSMCEEKYKEKIERLKQFGYLKILHTRGWNL